MRNFTQLVPKFLPISRDGNVIQMRNLIFVFLAVFCLCSAAQSQSLRFGSVTLKDTASGSIKHNTGGIYTNFVKVADVIISADAGDFYISGQGDGLMFYMNNDLVFYYPDGISLFVPFYLPQYTSSEINGLSVGAGAMVINSDTKEVWVFLDDAWKKLVTE